MKKVLIGVGVGCGVLVLVVVIGIVAAGMWAKQTFGDMSDDLQAVGEGLKENTTRAEALNARFPFDAPADREQPIRLSSARVDVWKKVAQVAQAQMEQLTEKFEAQQGKTNGPESLREGMAQLQAGAQVAQEAQAATLDALEANGMSPAEFTAISNTLMQGMTFAMTRQMKIGGADMIATMESSREQMAARLDDPQLDATLKENLRKSLEQMDERIAEMKEEASKPEAEENTAILEANAELIDARREELNELVAPSMAVGVFAGMGQ